MNENDLEAYEVELFQIKQHFLTKPWLRPTAKSRLTALEKWKALDDESTVDYKLQGVFTGTLKTDWELLTKHRSLLKLAIANAETARDLYQIVLVALSNEEEYAQYFSGIFVETNELKAGSPADEMALNRAMKRLADLNYQEVSDLIGKEDELVVQFHSDVPALNELKRLSLLYTYLKKHE